MTIKITIPNTSSDTLTFGSANTPTAAQIAGIDSGSSNGQLAIYTTASGTSTERVRVDSSGNVLVGTTSNTSTVGTAIRYGFDASSTIFVGKNNAPANANWMELAGGGATRAVLAWDTTGGGAWFGSTTTYPVSFYTNNTERMRLDTSGNLLFNSGYGSVATAYGCRAWIAWTDNGTATTTRGSGNVTSITRNATSDYTINFTTAMPDANYSITGNSGYNTTSMAALVVPINITAPTTSAVRVQSVSSDGTLRGVATNVAFYSIAIFR